MNLSKIVMGVERLFGHGGKAIARDIETIGAKKATDSSVIEFLKVAKKKNPVGYDSFTKGLAGRLKGMPIEEYNKYLQRVGMDNPTGQRLGMTDLFKYFYKEAGEPNINSWNELVNAGIKGNKLSKKVTLNEFADGFISRSGFSNM